MRSSLRIAVAVAAGLGLGAAAYGQTGHDSSPASAVNWGPAPPFLPAGARFAVLQGDPGQAGVYTIRLEFPAGYVIKPHFHPTDEHVTVLSGSFLIGMGDSVDARQGQVLGTGGFVTAPAQAHHFAIARRKTVIQIHGEGPFALTYVRAADDPRTAAATR
jgi:quercetin dioxygenase-like cupin family protein